MGLRYENTDFFANLIETNETTKLKYSNFFPSAFATYKFSDKESLQVSYSKRLRRPGSASSKKFRSVGI